MYQHQTPFDGNPRTIVRTQSDGSQEYYVLIKELTPWRKKSADWLRWGVGAGFAAISAVPLITMEQPPLWMWALPIPAFAGGALAGHFGLQHLFGKRRVVYIANDTFSIKTFWGWRHFDRQIPHAFTLLPHDKAKTEQEKHDLAARKAQLKGNVISKAKYYNESFHLCFEYLGQRHDIATIYGHKPAAACLARLKTIDQVIDSIPKTGNGTALGPSDQWSPQPGNLILDQ